MDSVARVADARRKPVRQFGSWRTNSLLSLCLSTLALIPIAAIVITYERVSVAELDISSSCLVFAAWLLIVSVALAVTKRLVFSLLASDLIICGLTALSIVKYKYLDTIIHSYDVVYYAHRLEGGNFFVRNYPNLAGGAALGLPAGLAILIFVFRIDRLRIDRRIGCGLLLVSLALYLALFQWYGRPRTVYRDAYHASTFFASIPETVKALRRGNLLIALAGGATKAESTAPPTSASATPDSAGVRPTIIVILHESTFPLELFPIVQSGNAPRDLFRSDDGKFRRLQVETWGGGTWTSEYGMLNGISTYYFGSLRNYLAQFMTGKIETGLALELKADGYKTIAIYPFSGEFMSSRRYDRSIGFDEFLDKNDLGASSEQERDSYYYAKVLEQIANADGSAPLQQLFIFVWTIASHSPYDHRLFPNLRGFDDVRAKDAKWTEYVRRLSIDEADLKDFLGHLRTQFKRPMIVLGFGDHQPVIAREFADPTKVSHTPFTTFYRVNSINFDPDFSKLQDSLDIPFLATALLEASRLPMSKSFQRRAQLLQMCDGRYSDCLHQERYSHFTAGSSTRA